MSCDRVQTVLVHCQIQVLIPFWLAIVGTKCSDGKTRLAHAPRRDHERTPEQDWRSDDALIHKSLPHRAKATGRCRIISGDSFAADPQPASLGGQIARLPLGLIVRRQFVSLHERRACRTARREHVDRAAVGRRKQAIGAQICPPSGNS